MNEPSNDSEESRLKFQRETQSFFARFAKEKNIDLDHLKTPEVRIQLIKSLTAEQFLDLLTIANSKLSGFFKRWERDYKGQDHHAEVTSGVQDSPDIDPPLHQDQEFQKFFNQMKDQITPENIDIWATKLYTAIVFLHMFPDGNGRVARNAFNFLNEGTVANDDTVSTRPSLIGDFCEVVNITAIDTLLKKDGDTRFDYSKWGGLKRTSTYEADEQPHFDNDKVLGLVGRLKFIAAKRAEILKSRAKNIDENSVVKMYGNGQIIGYDSEENYRQGEPYTIQTEPWSPEEQARFKSEYDAIRSEWFWEAQQSIDLSADIAPLWIDIALKIPNPFFLGIVKTIRIVEFISKDSIEEVKKIIDTDKNSADRTEAEKLAYIDQLKTAVRKNSEVVAKISEYLSSQKKN